MQTQANVGSGDRASVPRRLRLLGRAALGAAVAAGVCAALGTFLWGVVGSLAASVGASGPTTTTDLLTLLLAASALLLLLWLALVTLVAALCLVPGAVGRVAQRVAARLTPLLAARVLSLVLGSAIVGGAFPGAAVAGTGAPGSPGSAVATAPDPGFAPSTPSALLAATATPATSSPLATTASPSGLTLSSTTSVPPGVTPTPTGAVHAPEMAAPDPRFVPTRPRVCPVLGLGVLAQGGIRPLQGIVVHRGDTLWAIAARQLGTDATDSEVAAHWRRWYAANRAVIGPDPDLILPGQVLVPPATEAAR